jgi:dephospho-CoA kinase
VVKNKKIILGVTGSFGSGKSTVAGIFRSFGAKVIDADILAHQCLTKGRDTYRRIVKLFGKGILQEGGAIDRRKLAAIVFANTVALKKLNSIIHPKVIRQIKREIRRAVKGIIVLDVPLLVESGLVSLADKTIVVKMDPAVQLRRLRQKTSLLDNEILMRIKCQSPLRKKMRFADFIIDNSGTIGELKKKVQAIRRRLWKS